MPDPRRPVDPSPDMRGRARDPGGAGRVILVARAHPTPTQTFHRRTAAALVELGVPVERVALRRREATPSPSDGTIFPREEGARALRAFVRAPFASLALGAGLVLRARRGDKEGGRAGAALAWVDGLRLADWGRRRRGVARFHAQFASWEATAAWTAARLLRVPFSFEVHNPYTLVVGRGGLRAKARAADVVAAISEDARRRMLELDPNLASTVHVVPCGVAPTRLQGGGSDVPSYDVLAVGSLVPRKGHDVLVRAIAHVAGRHPGLRAAIVGEGPERGRLEALIAACGAPVELLGERSEEETLALTGHARTAVLACVVAPDGDEDGVPVALMEAMAAGVPVVSTAVGGIPELLDAGRAGCLVVPGDPVGCAVAISRLLDDAGLAAAVGRAGRAQVTARYDLLACAATLARVLGVPSPRDPAARRADRPADTVPGSRL